MSSDQASWSNVIFRCGLATATHPVEYAKTLIQLGHEPIAPKPTRTLFGRPALGLPNIFQYIGHIRKQDGFFGLYRGLGPKMCCTVIRGLAYQKATDLFIVHVEGRKLEKKRDYDTAYSEELEDPVEEEEPEEETAKVMIVNLLRNMTATTASIVASHPFHVIAVRTMAQFIGREQKYMGVFTSAGEIYRESGLSGFFQGLVPRLTGELAALVLASTVSFTVTTYMIGDRRYSPTVKMAVRFLAASLTYPFQVVATCMAVTGSGLDAGHPPCMPVYVNWVDCWSHLSQTRQLKRGSSILFRYYSTMPIKP